MDKQYYSIKEVAEIFGRDTQAINRWLKNGTFGKEGEGWKRSGPFKQSKIVITSEAVTEAKKTYL